MTIYVNTHGDDEFVSLRWGGKVFDRHVFENKFGQNPTVKRADLFEFMIDVDWWCYDNFSENAQFELG